MSDRRRALVTGGAGFVGSEVVAQLAGAGWDVTVLDDLSTGRWSNLDGVAPTIVSRVTGDVRDPALLARLLPGIDTVLHLACRGLRFSLHSPVETHEVNASGTLAVLEAARQANVRRLVHVSSSEVYGCSPRMPLDEDAATLPTTACGASKLAGEAYARAWHHSYGLPVAIVRPFNAFGPRRSIPGHRPARARSTRHRSSRGRVRGRSRLRPQVDAEVLGRLAAYRAAHAALTRGAHDEALILFERALSHPVAADRDRAILALLRNRAARIQRGDIAGAEADTALLARFALPARQIGTGLPRGVGR